MGQLGFYFSLNEFLAVLFSFGFAYLRLSRCAFSSVLPHFLAHAIEHKGNGSSCSPTSDLNCLLSGVMAIVRQGEVGGYSAKKSLIRVEECYH